MPTKIKWCDETWNPIVGCSRVSPGCENCYAERMAARFSGPGGSFDGAIGKHGDGPARWNGNCIMRGEKNLNKPRTWRKPRRVFVNSMGDLFHEGVQDAWISKVYDVMAEAHWHTYLVLTKRPTRMRGWLMANNRGTTNIWHGVTVENQGQDWRIRELRASGTGIKFVSIEPMLGEVDLPHGVDWVICGAETGPGRRAMGLHWARGLRDKCKAAGVPFFFKKDSCGRPTIDGEIVREFPRG